MHFTEIHIYVQHCHTSISAISSGSGLTRSPLLSIIPQLPVLSTIAPFISDCLSSSSRRGEMPRQRNQDTLASSRHAGTVVAVAIAGAGAGATADAADADGATGTIVTPRTP